MAENNPHLPDIARASYGLSVVGSLFAQRTINQFFYVHDGIVADAPSNTQVATEFWNTVSPAWLDTVSADWTARAILVRRLDVYGFASTVWPIPLVAGDFQKGTRGDAMSPMDAVVLKRTTFAIGKRSRGRVYIAGLAEEDHKDGQVTAAALGGFDDLCDSLDDPLVIGAEQLTAHHLAYKHTPPDIVSLEGAPVVGWTVDPILGTQRRRRIGHGV
jgi:hypothetical protein